MSDVVGFINGTTEARNNRKTVYTPALQNGTITSADSGVNKNITVAEHRAVLDTRFDDINYY